MIQAFIEYTFRTFKKPNNGLNKILMVHVLSFLLLTIIRFVLYFYHSIGAIRALYVYEQLLSFFTLTPAFNLYNFFSIITYSFVYKSILFFGFNFMAIQWIGTLVTYFLGNKHFVRLYFFSAVGCGLLFLLLAPWFKFVNHYTYLAGPAVIFYTLITAFATFAPDFNVGIQPFFTFKIKYLALFILLNPLLRVIYEPAYSHEKLETLVYLFASLIGFLYASYIKEGEREVWTHWFQEQIRKRKFVLYRKKKGGAPATSKKKAISNKILKKIEQKGYSSLTKEEKKELFPKKKEEKPNDD